MLAGVCPLVHLGSAAAGDASADDICAAASRMEHAPHRAGFTAQGIIRSSTAFLMLQYAEGLRTLKAGEYKFEEPATALDVWRRLVRGDVYARTVVVPEGYNIYDIAAAVEQAGLGPAADFIAVAKGDMFLVRDIDPDAKSLEGYLFPDTYQFTRIDSAHDIAAAMVRRFRQEAQKIGLLGHPDMHAHRDHGVDRGEGNRGAGGASARGRRVLQPAGEEHAAGGRPSRDLCGVAGGTLSRDHLPVGLAVRLALQHIQICGAASGADCQSRGRVAGGRDASRPD